MKVKRFVFLMILIVKYTVLHHVVNLARVGGGGARPCAHLATLVAYGQLVGQLLIMRVTLMAVAEVAAVQAVGAVVIVLVI
ncbi:MAG: hypothetical protein WA277_12005 [Nitrospirota bacterium]